MANESTMPLNRAIQRKVEHGDALDVSKFFSRETGQYELPEGFFQEGKDYADTLRNRWIWSIGQRDTDGKVFAATTTQFYQAQGFTCLWLR